MDGSLLFLGPKERWKSNAPSAPDIAMVFDECPAHDAPAKSSGSPSNARSAGRANAGTTAPPRASLFSASAKVGAIRRYARECAKALVAMEFDGYAIGGVSVGEPGARDDESRWNSPKPFLPAHKARYAMGLGTPAQMVELIARRGHVRLRTADARGVRNGTAYTRKGAIGIKGATYKTDFRPIEEGCDCFACRHFTRAYLRHLLRVNEILGLRMLSVHNSTCM